MLSVFGQRDFRTEQAAGSISLTATQFHPSGSKANSAPPNPEHIER
jgi:hypothetical protein